MSRAKMVYVSEPVHQRLKVLAARRRRTLGQLVGDLVEREAAESANPWIQPEGLLLQQKSLNSAWEDPALDVYNRPRPAALAQQSAGQARHRRRAIGRPSPRQ